MLLKILISGLLLLNTPVYTFFNERSEGIGQTYIYILKYTEDFKKNIQWNARELGIAQEHVSYIKELADENKAYLLGRTTNIYEVDLFGVIVFEASSLEEAKKILQNDPLVKNDIMQGTVSPFSIVFVKEKK
jgi:uncharacterized protein YciI